ncbi:MAG: hypothetical protein ABIC40_09040 [bacterium]
MKSTGIIIAAILLALVSFGCSKGHGGFQNPVTPSTDTGLAQSSNPGDISETHLWGYYDVMIDLASQTAIAEPNRNVMFTANVTTFINSKPANLSFDIVNTPVTANWIDVDIDVSITHPFATLPQYKGYDVRGVFIGDGSDAMDYNHALKYAVAGVDQTMLDDPSPELPFDPPGGSPDGYTRWYNPGEFSTPGLFGYLPGKIASPGYSGTATLNPYKYFADGLGKNDSAFDFLTLTGDHGVFSNGTTNTRNYYIRFPKTKGLKFCYAVIADWKSELPEDHPSNAIEALTASVTLTDNVYYSDPTLNGGYIIMDVSLFDWGSSVNESGYMDDYNLKVESNVLYDTYNFDTWDMTPIGGNEAYSTYHVEIEADNVKGTKGNEFWLIAECPGSDYENELGVTNDANGDTLAAFFRYDINVSATAPNYPPVITGIEDDIIGGGSYKSPVDFYDNNVTYTVLFTDPDIDDTHTISWYIVDFGTAPSLSDEVTMPVDWSTYNAGQYEIHVYIKDGTFTVHGGPYPITMNTTPVINSGVTGNASPLLVNTETYSVDAFDPDNGQTLSYSWTVTDLSTGNPLSGYDGVPGDGAGSLDVDWKAIGATDDHDYEIDCTVDDSMIEVDADTLAVTTTVNLYFANFQNGNGGMEVVYNAYPDPGLWTYDPSYDVWKESGFVYTSTMYYQYARTRMRTPIFSVPAGITQVRVDLRQWYQTAESGDPCYLQYTTNGGTAWTNITSYWLAGGSSGYDLVQTYNVPAAIINKTNAAIGFYFSSNYNSNYIGVGWNIREIRVYIVP